jgi:hypothetical protein
MSEKTLKVSYWTATLIFAVLLVMDGLGGVMRADAGVEALQHLGYPGYFLPLAGFAKLLAAVAILQSRFSTIKEWAFAGFAFTCLGAFFSRVAVGDGAELLVFPVIFLGIMLVPYVLWKKYVAQRVHKEDQISAFSSGTATPS